MVCTKHLWSYLLCILLYILYKGDGQITPQELAAVMKALGESLSEQDIMVMIQEADADGDGNIDFDGLCIYIL